MKSQMKGVRNTTAMRMAAAYQMMVPTLRRRESAGIGAARSRSEGALGAILYSALSGLVVHPSRTGAEDDDRDRQNDHEGNLQQGTTVAKQLIRVELLECVDHEQRVAVRRHPRTHAAAPTTGYAPGGEGDR